MRKLIPSAELVMVEQAGHPGFLERSAAYDDAIAGFAAWCVARHHARGRPPPSGRHQGRPTRPGQGRVGCFRPGRRPALHRWTK